MSYNWSDDAWEDYLYWQSKDKKMVEKIHRILKEIRRNPAEGIGKPEKLRNNLSGYWSRRLNKEHRIVYKVIDSRVEIVMCRYHYE